MTETIKKSFKHLNWKLLITIFATLLIPVIYRTLRMFFIGTMPGTWNFSMAANLQWINVMFEVLEEAFLLPLFFTLRNILKSNKEDANRKISWQIIMISIIYLVAIIALISCTRQLTEWLDVKNVTNTTIKFIRIELITRWFVMLGKIGLVLLVAKNRWKELIVILALNTTINIFLDMFIASDNEQSLNMGILWVGYDQLLATSFVSMIYMIMIYKIYHYKAKDLIPLFFISRIDWKQYLYSGLESFVRNAFFIWFVIKTINKLDSSYNSGDFWVMNSFIWDWLLLPILALSQYMNRDQAFNDERAPLKERLAAPFVIISITTVIWFALIPTYKPFIEVVLNNKDYEVIGHLAIISIGFYVSFAFNDPIDKILFGDGKAQYILAQSLIVNTVIYIPYYYLKDSMTIDDVAIMMGSAIALDSAITFVMFFVWFKNKRISA